MCSYGVGNVGTYNSSFTGVDINEQAFNNPAGRYNYSELVAQAMNQTYVINELFDNSGVPQSLFLTFLPNDTMPNTSFLFAPTPTEATRINPDDTQSSVFSPVPTEVTNPDGNDGVGSSIFAPTPTETTNPAAGGTGGAESLVFSCSLVAVLAYSVLTVLL